VRRTPRPRRSNSLHHAIEQADCIINVGHDVVEKPPFVMHHGGANAKDPTVIHVDFSPAEVDAVYAPQIEVTGDIANAVWRLGEAVSPSPRWEMGVFDEARRVLYEHLEREADDARFPVHPPRLVAEVQRAMPDDGVVCLDNGMYKLWFARYFRARSPNSLLLDNALATMGAGLPSAIAAKLVHPERKVLAVVGDGGLMMCVQELETAVRLGLDLTVLVVRDDGYGMIRWKQAEMGLPDHAMTFGNPDFVRLAEAFGAHGHRATSADETGALLGSCLDATGVHVIDVPIDYEANHRVLGEELRLLGRTLATATNHGEPHA
jgi:acetolactate synthase I/II/III large subunit